MTYRKHIQLWVAAVLHRVYILKSDAFGWKVDMFDLPNTNNKVRHWPFKRIVFHITSTTQLKILYSVEDDLASYGVSFDKGLGAKDRTWYINHSFKVIKQEA